MATFTIPGGTVPQGTTEFGPVAIRRWRSAQLTVNLASMVDPIFLSVQVSDDGGATWRMLVRGDFLPGSWPSPRTGLTTTDATIDVSLGSADSHATHVKAVVENPTAFVTTGGSLVVT